MTMYRNIISTVLPLAGAPMFQTPGLGWGNSVPRAIALATVPVPFLLLIYGERIRKSSRIEQWL